MVLFIYQRFISEKIANTIANTGTIIVVNEPFAQLPVRRRVF
jgi:DNA mismatch repair ATPase MutL